MSVSISRDVLPALAAGAYDLQARLTDPSGNQGTSGVSTLSIDLVPPAVSSIVRAGADPTSASAVEFKVNIN